MKMRELEERTGVHREMIRVYLRERLIPEPARPRKTVVDYGEEHVQAILAVRRLQRENRLTLAQIKAIIGGEGTEGRVEASAFDQLEQLVAHRVGADGPPVTIASLLERQQAELPPPSPGLPPRADWGGRAYRSEMRRFTDVHLRSQCGPKVVSMAASRAERRIKTA